MYFLSYAVGMVFSAPGRPTGKNSIKII